MPKVLGVDGGGTRSRAVVVDETGVVLAYATGGATNPNSVGRERSRQGLNQLVSQCLAEAGVPTVDVAVFGLAGVNNRAEEREVEEWLRTFGFCRNISVENDSIAAWAAATLGEPGVVIIAGTGSIAFGVDQHGNRRRAGGWGYVFGDEGSGFGIVSEALRAAARCHDGRGPKTRLLPALLQRLGLSSTDGLTRAVYTRGMETGVVANLLPTVVEVAGAGDAVALDIFLRAGRELAQHALAVINGLELDTRGNAFPVGLSGGVFESGELITESLREVLRVEAPASVVRRVVLEPVFGAALLALQEAGVFIDQGMVENWLSIETPLDVQVNAPELSDVELDRLSTLELLRYLNQHDQSVPGAVERQLPAVARAVDAIVEALSAGGCVFYVGAGTSGRLGLLDAVECPPTFGYSPKRFRAILAGGSEAVWHSVEAAEDDAAAGARAVRDSGVSDNDVVVAIAASGSTPFTVGATRQARAAGAATVGVTATPGSALASVVDIAIAVDTGPEAVFGSTRLKAGTAQKLILNMLSTAASVRLGKVYGRWMVDVEPTNAKLGRRALGIVQAVTGCREERAQKALEACDYEAKTAIVCIVRQVSPAGARELLREHGGFLRQVLEGAGDHGQ